MFNGYNDSALISYEYNQEREKKSDNVSKYSYGLDGGVQPPPMHPNNRQSEFWSGKPNFIGIPNVVKCNCTGCYPTTENQSYQVESTRHRPWLPKTFPVPLNGSNEAKLPAYQWDSNLNQICYSDPNIPYGQENVGKNSYYRQIQNPNQPSVIISANKQKNEMGFQNGVRQPVMCNPGYDLTKRVNGRGYYDGDKYSSLGSYSINQIPRFPVEPYTKAVPSNLNQTRVPSAGHRKENSPQYDHYSGSKIRPENYYAGLSPIDLKNSGIHVDYSYFNRDSDYYTDIKRNNVATSNRKDLATTQVSLEQHYGRAKHPENLKGCDMFYPNLEKNQMESCIQRIENDGMNRLPRSVAVCNDLRFPDERSQVFQYQSNGPRRNYVRPEYQQFNSQYGIGFQEPEKNQFRTLPQQLPSCDQLPQGNNGCIVDPQKANSEKILSQSRTQIVLDAQSKANYLETIRSEDLSKNGTHKISPLRLLRKKKFIPTSQEMSSATNTVDTPALDVRKFWSTWAEEDENVCPTQMVVLDCQNLDPEQAKLLNFYETDPSRPINLENVIIKNPDCTKDNTESVKTNEQPVHDQEKQTEILTPTEPVIKSTGKVTPELEAVNVSPKKCRSQENRKKKIEEAMDKWTEKKFDFLKKSEESKAAEIFRLEEEKKRIFERRQSFQQIGANKIETHQEDISKCEEDSQSNSPKERAASDLPTSEYRRNKFLDYSEVIVSSCKNSQKLENKEQEDVIKVIVKSEESEAKQEGNSPLEMDDILKKMSEINFQEIKSESVIETKKEKKTKKKKLEQQETDARTDLKLGTTSKPTIKFSIQKSHDLKISFKVLNKKYEEEEERKETKPIEDADTELITLKYKSIQNGGKLSDSKKMRKKLRRKKHAPVLKIKKSRYMEEERDPLADDDEAKAYLTDGFQVQETVDSAKIKLTFKRHKTNLETEYKINKENLDVVPEEVEVTSDDSRLKKKSKKTKHEIFAQEDFESTMEERSGADSDAESITKNHLELTPKEHSEKLFVFDNASMVEEDTYENPTSPFGTTLPEKRLCEFIVQNDVREESKCEIDGEKQVDVIVNCDEANQSNVKDKFSPVENVGVAISKSPEDEKASEKIQEISLDSIRSINSPDIETNCEIEKTEDIEASDAEEEERNENGEGVIESTNENHSNLESSYDVNNRADPLDEKTDLEPISPDKRNASLELGSDNNVGFEVGDENTSEKDSLENRIESESVCSLETNPEDILGLKLIQSNLVECDCVNERTEGFQSDFENVIISKVVENESNIEMEKTSSTVDGNTSENGVDCLEENAERETDPAPNCEEVSLKDKNVGEEQPGLCTIKPYNELLLNENIQESSPQMTEGNERVENSEPCEDRENQDCESSVELKSKSNDLATYEDKESKLQGQDQDVTGDLCEDDKKNFFSEFKPTNSEYYEKVENFNDSNISEFPSVSLTSAENEGFELDNTLNRNSDKIVDESFTEQTEHQEMEIVENLISNNTKEFQTPSPAVQFEDIHQAEEITTLQSDTELSASEHIEHENGTITEQELEMEVISNSKNQFFDEATNPSTEPPELCERESVGKSNSAENVDLSTLDDQNIEVINLGDLENCSHLESKENETQELSKANNSQANSTGRYFQSEIFDQEQSEIIVPETTEHDNIKSEDKFVNNFESDVEIRSKVFCLEKPDEDDKESERLTPNETIPLFEERQDNTIIIENSKQLDSSVVASPVDHSGINSWTISAEIKLDGETTFANNSSAQLNSPENNSLELPSNLESDLEDGEIVDDSSDESESKEPTTSSFVRKPTEFKVQKPTRRHSIYHHNIESHTSWCQRKFIKSKSCPPRFKFDLFEDNLNIPVEDIPLPVGPPPLSSCFNFNKSNNEEKVSEEAKEKTERPSAEFVLKMNQKETVEDFPSRSPFVGIELQNCENPSPLHIDAFGIQRSKIKFSLVKRSRFSKIGFQYAKPKILDPPKLIEKSEPNIIPPEEDKKPEVTKDLGKSESDIKSSEKTEPVFNEIPDLMMENEKANFSEVEVCKSFVPENSETKEIAQTTLESAEETKEDCESTKTPEEVSDQKLQKIENLEASETSEVKAIECSETEERETVVEDLGFEVVESLIDTNNETEIYTSKIRTPDYISETIEEVSECQIIEVPNASPVQTKEGVQKNELQVESLCEDSNAEVVDVMSDFMRDEFYENIPTSEDLPNGDSADEKVNDDKFRNIMQNCLENAKKFLNVGNLKLFSCSVDDLLELDNQENETPVNHISRDVLLTSCEDVKDELGLNEKFQPVDISMEFIPSDVCPEILPVDNWPYLEEEVPSSPLKSNEADLILENTVSEVVSNRKRTAKESENYKRFRRKSLIDDEQTPCSKIATHRRKTIDSFLPITKLNGIDQPNEGLKCRLSLEKLTKNGVQFISSQNEFSQKIKNTKFNYKSPLWQPKVMLIRISEEEMKRFKKTKIRRPSFENRDSSTAIKKPKKDHADGDRVENEIILPIPDSDSVKGMITTTDAKKHKPRFRNLHTKRKPEQEQKKPKAIETALSELFKDSDEELKYKSEKTNKNEAEVKIKSEPKSDRHSSKCHSHRDKHDHRDRRRGSDKEQYKHKDKHRHERRKHDDERRHRSNHSDHERKRSVSKNSGDEKEMGLKDTWACEVCGFNDANERVAHIKNHPFHCQSCHLAFKTEAYFNTHLTEMHKDIRNQHHCLLCELSFDTEEEYQHHLETREHTHLEAVEKNTINTLFTLLTGAPCPVLGVVEVKPEWLPNQPGTVHFYHQATPLSLALQYLKMHHDLTSYSEVPKVHPN